RAAAGALPGARPVRPWGPRLPDSALTAGAVAGAGMAVQTVQLSARRSSAASNRVDELVVAPDAVRLDQAGVTRCDLDGLLEVLQREGGRMPEAVVRL